MRPVVRVLTDFGHGAPALILAGDGTDVLAVAVPAALALIDGTAELLQGCVGRRLVPDPLDVARLVAHRAGRAALARLGDGDGEQPLDEDRERDEKEPGAKRVESHPRAAPRPGAGSRLARTRPRRAQPPSPSA